MWRLQTVSTRCSQVPRKLTILGSNGKAWVGHVGGIGNRRILTEERVFQKTESAIIWVTYCVVAC
jgi:hypothetical protein